MMYIFKRCSNKILWTRVSMQCVRRFLYLFHFQPREIHLYTVSALSSHSHWNQAGKKRKGGGDHAFQPFLSIIKERGEFEADYGANFVSSIFRSRRYKNRQMAERRGRQEPGNRWIETRILEYRFRWFIVAAGKKNSCIFGSPLS